MKSTTYSTHRGHTSPADTDYDGILTLLTILLGEIVIIDVMGL